MKKTTTIWLFILSLIGTGVGYVLTNSIKFQLCIAERLKFDASCVNLYERLGDPLFYGLGALTIVFLFLIFFPQAVQKWKKFAIWYIPLATIIFIFYQGPSSGDLFSPYPEQVFRWLSCIYIIVSVIVIVLSHRKRS